MRNAGGVWLAPSAHPLKVITALEQPMRWQGSCLPGDDVCVYEKIKIENSDSKCFYHLTARSWQKQNFQQILCQ